MIDRATIDRILDAVHIEEVIGDFVALKKRGSDYKGLCPFHEDRNPSMSVSPARGIFKCFSCGKAGTALSFVMDHEHMSYPEALKYLANKYHIEIVEKQETAEEIAGRMRYESLQVVSDYAAKFFQDTLWNTEEGRAIGLSYFKERSFSDETIKKFGLGYAAGRSHSLATEAVKAGYKSEYLVDTNVCIQKESGEIADRFYERVMFPIHSISGRVIAFGGRTLKNDKNIAKYINTSDTEIYHKSNSLYGIFFAKNAISKADKCILVEGYADVISMHQAGIENVVASSGTSLTVGQIHLIKRFTDNVTILYDGDEAGIKASVRGTDLLLEEGMKVKVVLLPPEDDPDTFAKAHSKEEFLEYIAEHECDFITHKSNLLSSDAANDPYRRSQLINDIIKSISVIPDQVLRKVYVEQVSETFNQDQDDILQKIVEIRRKKRELERSRRNIDTREQWTNDGSYIPTEVYPIPDDIPQEYGQEGYQDSNSNEPNNRYAITNTFLSFSEKELVYYLIKFGVYPLYFEKDMKYGATAKAGSVSVQEYIKKAMDEDELEFQNTLYKEMYNEFFSFYASVSGEDYKSRQSQIIRRFSTHPNPVITNAALDMICETHQLTVKTYQDSIAPEEYLLATMVPKAVLLYKSRYTEQACMQLNQEISKAQKEGNITAQKELLGQLQLLIQVKNQLSKELKKI